MENKIDIPAIMVIFGGTGDLTHRKLIPAIYNLERDGLLSKNFAVVAVGRRAKSDNEYRDELLLSVKKFCCKNEDKNVWDKLSKRIYYYRLDFPDSAAYEGLNFFLDQIEKIHNTTGNRLYYLSVAPEHFETITINLKNNNMAENRNSWQRLVIEKPFGRDLRTAEYLNKVITGVFPEENIFRIDHYLGKEMLQNIMVIRFGNAMFEGIWNSRYIDNVQITSSETVGVENRAGYYDNSGALRDMVQNHLLQLLALVAMEPPVNLTSKAIKDEKIKLFHSLNKFGPDNFHGSIVRGQYGTGTINNEPVIAYRDENGVSDVSNTETFVAMRLFAGNFRWGNVPFYLRTGKRMKEKTTSIIIEFKSLPEILYFKEFKGMQPNLLEIRVQPSEGISLQFNTKMPGTSNEITNVKMDFSQSSLYEGNTPEAYQRLIADVLRNDQTLFTSWDEIAASWSFIDSIYSVWNKECPIFPNYASGTWGPAEADELLNKNGHKWWIK